MKTARSTTSFRLQWVFLLPALLIAAAASAEERVNPHWTGKHCAECHVNGTPPALLHDGDPVKLCMTCHETGHSGTDVHSLPLAPSAEMKSRIPDDWPLYKDSLSCFTCHEPKMQMYKNEKLKKNNPNFLRGEEHHLSKTFCFNCHSRDTFQKSNPHQQLDENGRLISEKCLFCHKTRPDPDKDVSLDSVDFIDTLTNICTGCHPGKDKSHPARYPHQVKITDDRPPVPDSLPLKDNTVFCGTCHNPHQQGVIKNQKASIGAGHKQFIRAETVYDLCILCHPDKKIAAWDSPPQQPDLLRKAPGPMINHNPWQEKKCKICHSVTPFNRARPPADELCFRDGCHKQEIIDKTFVHEPSVTRNCYFCHESHTAEYKNLLRVNEEKMCYVCHPLLPDHAHHIEMIKNDAAIHKRFDEYLRKTGLTDSRKCTFCHDPNHKKQIRTVFPGICSDCHIFINKILADPKNIHSKNRNRVCSDCHEPHSGSYKYQLKQPPETYKDAP